MSNKNYIMIRNFKFKIVVVEGNEGEKSKMLDELLMNILPESFEFLENYCILGSLKVDKGLFYYKILDTKLAKAPVIISNSFFPEIHALIFVYTHEMLELQDLFTSVYKDLYANLSPNCIKVLVSNQKSPLPNNTLNKFPDFHYFSLQDSQISEIFDHILSTLKQAFQVPNKTPSIPLNTDPANNESCC